MEPTYTELSRAVKADADRMTALLRYYGLVDMTGFPHLKDTRSRAQREGFYGGTVDGRPMRFSVGNRRVLFSTTNEFYVPTRKALKAAKMEMLNSTRRGAYGGTIKEFHNRF